MAEIEKLKILAQTIDKYYKELAMANYCKNCEYNCCRGGIWLCYSEEKELAKTINIHESYFIDNFSRVNKNESMKLINDLPCPYYNSSIGKNCFIYDKRPLVCRLIPVDLIRIKDPKNKRYFWVLKKYCLLYRKSYGTAQFDEITKTLRKMTNELNEYIDDEFILYFDRASDIYFLDDVSENTLYENDEYILLNEVR